MNDRPDDPVAAAIERFFAAFPAGPVGVESVELGKACARVLAADVKAAIDSPPFSRALVEGFLVNAADTANAGDDTPVSLTVSGAIGPGKTFENQIPSGTCMEVSTGSFIPEGA